MEHTVTPAKMTRTFVSRRGQTWTPDEKTWMQTVFGIICKVARSEKEFTVDAIWAEIDALTAKKKMPKSKIDHRILGPMIRHMVSEGMLSSSGYYTKSMRQGGGSRPITIWTSHMYKRTMRAKAAA